MRNIARLAKACEPQISDGGEVILGDREGVYQLGDRLEELGLLFAAKAVRSRFGWGVIHQLAVGRDAIRLDELASNPGFSWNRLA